MKIPSQYAIGLQELLQNASPDRLAIVRITSETLPQAIDALVARILRDIPLPQERIFKYTPPDEISFRGRYRSRKPRVEKVPLIADPSLTYIIVDDLVDRAMALSRAVEIIAEQGVPRNKIWFLGHMAYFTYLEYYQPLLDQADVFINYARFVHSGLEKVA